MVTQWRCQPWHCKASASTMWTPHPPSWPSLSEFYFSSLTIPTDTGDYNAWKKGVANNIRRKKKRFFRINPTVICCCCCCWLRLGGGVVAQADQELLLPGRRAVSHWRQPQLIRAPPATLATLLLLLLLLLQPAPPRMDLSRAQQPAVSNPLCSIWEENDCRLSLPGPSWTLWVSHCLALSCCRMVLSNVWIPHYSLQQRDSNGLDHHLDDKDVVPGVT